MPKTRMPERLTSLRNPKGPEARALLRDCAHKTPTPPMQEIFWDLTMRLPRIKNLS